METAVSTSLPLVLAAAAAGGAAGFALAVPLGPVGLLLVDVASRRGARHGAAAAAGIASVDLVYATLAVGLGAAASAALAPVATPLRWTASLVLVALGLRGVWTAHRSVDDAPTSAPRGGPLRTGAGFVAVTAINPGTLLHAGIVVVALADRLTTVATRVAFVLALAAASLTWQTGMVIVGLALGRVPRPAVRRNLRLLGSAAVAVLGVVLATSA